MSEMNASANASERSARSGQYRVILADPPWAYQVWNAPKAIMKRDGTRMDGKRVATAYYSTLTPDAIKALPIRDFAARDCALFLWATMPCLPEALAVMDAWGFRYVTTAFCWVKTYRTNGKPVVGLGHYTRGNAIRSRRWRERHTLPDARASLSSRG